MIAGALCETNRFLCLYEAADECPYCHGCFCPEHLDPGEHNCSAPVKIDKH